MTEQDYLKEVDYLSRQCELYYGDIFGESEISDAEYDMHRRMVQQYEIAHDIPEEKRFANRIGHKPADGSLTRKHIRPRKSLENALNKEEAAEWFGAWGDAFGKNVELTAEFKYDGAATVLRYVDGKLVLALTRGDGETGEDITEHAMRYVQREIAALGEVEIEGETVLPCNVMHLVKTLDNEPYASPRAAASGLLLRGETQYYHRYLRFVPYGITMPGIETLSQSDRLRLLRELSFETGPYFACTPDNAQETFVRMVKEEQFLDYDCDGVVFKLDGPDKQAILGETAHSPKWAFAYKKPPVTGKCTLIGVDFSVGRSGEISPVAKITPTILQGVTVTSAYLHNEKKMAERGTHIGSVYEIYRSGDVIPHLGACLSRKLDAPDVTFPKVCPACGSAIEKHGDTHYCTQRGACPGAQEAKIVFAVSRESLNIDGIGSVLAHDLFTAGYAKNVADLFDLVPDKIMRVGYSKNQAERIYKEIQNARDSATYRFITALCIPGVGKTTARAIASNLKAATDFLKWTDKKEIVAKKVSGVGPATADAIAGYLSDENTASIAARLFEKSNATGKNKASGNQIHVGVTNRLFVFTGGFPGGKERFEEMVLSRGGEVSSTVTPTTSYVIRGEKPGKKLQLAQAYGVPVMDAQEFLHYIENCVIISRVQ